jgi:hypothetical protein
MDYTTIIKTSEGRQIILAFFRWVPDKVMIQIQYFIKQGHRLNLKEPKRFTEHLQYYKIHYRNKTLHTCVDKYEVRNYIEKIGCADTLNELYGVYDAVEDIDFSSLPQQFVLKKTNGGGGLNVILCQDKDKLNMEIVKKQLRGWLKPVKDHFGGREWAYYSLKSRIICERYLENDEHPEAGISDYKFFCFHGVAKYLVVDVDRFIGHKRNFYDRNWTYLGISSDCPNFGDTLPKVDGFEEMITLAEKISAEFPFVRVDLYRIAGKTYFGELTFYPWSGYVTFSPDEFDYTLGKCFNLTKRAY